jgi:REP element-mobilizing transposase RayT
MEKYNGIYRKESRRLKGWDYGDILDDEIHLTEEGIISYKYLPEIEKRYSYIKVDNFVVMPNHIHAILIMKIDAINRAATKGQNIGGVSGVLNPMLNTNISRIIRWYKGRVTYEIRKLNPSFCWQANYHDHIIRDNKGCQKIYDYIDNNPLKWSLDKFNPKNIKL